jgi:hypothetical protein
MTSRRPSSSGGVADTTCCVRSLAVGSGSMTARSTGCGKLTSFFEYEMPYEKGSQLATPCISTTNVITCHIYLISTVSASLHLPERKSSGLSDNQD